MDEAFITEFCNRMALVEKNRRAMYGFYLFGDKRQGTITERFDADARLWAEYQKLSGRKM